MIIPERYRPLNMVGIDADGHPTGWAAAAVYPPPGFLEIPIFQLGNGDVCGFYWPVGRESNEPILCETYHDSWTIEPHASTLEGLVKIRCVTFDWERDDSDWDVARGIAKALAFKLPKPNSEASAGDRMLLDDSSPAALVECAEGFLRSGDTLASETMLLRVVDVLPEYGRAHALLAGLYQRLGMRLKAVQRMLELIGCPSCFGGQDPKLLPRLQRLKDDDYPELAGDPIWRERRRLTFATGVKTCDDFPIFEDAIAEYLASGEGVKAVRVRMVVGERMWAETTAFRDRYQYSSERHRQLLADNIRNAGLTSRLPAVGDDQAK